jgi:hypothetical protein
VDPSCAPIAAKLSLRAHRRHGAEVAAGARILNWVRRCAERWADGRFVLEQQTNAYAVLPETGWRGYRPPLEAPEPEWGRAPIMATGARSGGPGERSGGQGAGAGQRSEGWLAAALARLGQAFLARNA